MAQPLRIGLVFDYNLAYPRGVLRGISRFARSLPHWILVPLDIDGLTLRVLKAVRPDAVIALVVSETLCEALKTLRRPIVNVASVLAGLPFPRVGVDHHQVGELAARHFRERGFRHFGFVGHPTHCYSRERETGFRCGLRQAGRTLICYHEQPARSYHQRGRLLVLKESLRLWLSTLPKPAGVFACHDVWGLQVVEACRVAGVRVPDEVAVVGVDNDDLLCGLARPSLSSIIVPAERIGFEAAAMLERLLGGEKPAREPLLIPPGDVVTRQSSDVLAGADPDVSAAVRFIRDHAHQPLSVEDVLRAVSASRRTLERRFRALLERGLGEEIRRVHLERARGLLATTLLSVAEVAEQSGFASVHYLSRVFRESMGLTPTEYRRQFRTSTAQTTTYP